MIYLYPFNDFCAYIPSHMNAIFNSKYLSFEVDLIDDFLGSSILDQIVSADFEYFIIDLEGMKSAHSRIFEDYSGLHSFGKHLIFINADPTLRSHILGTLKGSTDDDGALFSSGKAHEYFINTLNDNAVFSHNLEHFFGSIVASYLNRNSIREDIFLDSSNIYSNMYVDVKRLFYSPQVFLYSIYQLCRKITKNFSLSDFDGFICASNNGSVIATLVGILLNKRTVYIMNLGPHLTIMDREIFKKIKENQKYLFIYDFICLGTEMKLVKTVVSLQGAEVLASFGIAKHHLPSRISPGRKYDTTTHALISINDEYDFQYIVSIQ